MKDTPTSQISTETAVTGTKTLAAKEGAGHATKRLHEPGLLTWHFFSSIQPTAGGTHISRSVPPELDKPCSPEVGAYREGQRESAMDMVQG